MSYPSDPAGVKGTKGAATTARFRLAADVEQIDFWSGSSTRFVAPGVVTDREFGLFEWNLPPSGGGADPHSHKTFSESFYVLSGTIGLYDGDRWISARPGDFLYVPRTGVHAFRNDADEPASMLILFAPAPPREKYFRELAEVAESGRTLSYDEWTELFAHHDQYRA
ncbi:MAG TPA: cupin domain-containing protein [Actinocrinis sp.]|nr:cupin domain-containing protein [Actinocrinis sp.]